MRPHNERRHSTKAELHKRIAQLERLVQELSISPVFGCLTRSALDVLLRDFDFTGLGVIYWDIDKLKELNLRWGKEESSRRIREAIAARSTDCVAGQVFSGDEFIAFPQEEDCLQMAQRIRDAMHALGISATFLITRLLPDETPAEMLKRLDQQSDAFKALGRDTIYVI